MYNPVRSLKAKLPETAPGYLVLIALGSILVVINSAVFFVAGTVTAVFYGMFNACTKDCIVLFLRKFLESNKVEAKVIEAKILSFQNVATETLSEITGAGASDVAGFVSATSFSTAALVGALIFLILLIIFFALQWYVYRPLGKWSPDFSKFSWPILLLLFSGLIFWIFVSVFL